MRNQKIVDHLMNLIYEEYRYRWCNGGPCACMGAVNCTGNQTIKKHGASPITYDEWLFGDHVRVTAKFIDNKVVFETEEYTDHD